MIAAASHAPWWIFPALIGMGVVVVFAAFCAALPPKDDE